MRLLSCRFAAVLPILTFSVLALAQGTTPSQTHLLEISPGAQSTFAVSVRAGTSVQPPFPRPTGTVTIYNGTTAIGSPGVLSANSGFTSASFAQVFGMPDPSVTAAAGGAVWGDFNEDGRADLLVYGAAPGSGSQPGMVVQVFAANALPAPTLHVPSFTPLAARQLPLPQYGQTLAVLDVDGDGHLDLLAGNTVAYGKGDGTFGRVAVLPALATGYDQTYAVDIDGDGKVDIVAVDTPPAVSAPGTVQYAFTVFHNAGSGSFTAMGPYPLAPSFAAGSSAIYNIFGLSFADVNGDGRIDVLSQSNAIPPVTGGTQPARLNVMLNLGTGFGSPQAIDTSAILDLGMVSIAFADLNNDGKQDLVFSYQANTVNNGVATLLGNGDGTFAAPVNLTIGNTVTVGSPLLPLAIEDVDADGNGDVVLGSGVLLMGKGDGTLTAGTPLFTSTVAPGNAPPAYALVTTPATASIPRGEDAPFFALVFVNLLSGANALFIPNIGSGAEPTAQLMPGTYSLTAHYSGDATYAASVSGTVNVTIASSTPPPTTMTLTSSANPIYASQSVTFTATLSDPTITGSITFVDISKNDDNPLDPMAGTTESTLGTGTIANGVATLTTTLPVGGTHTILAVYGSDIYAPIAQGQLTETVNVPFSVANSTQEITLAAASGKSVSTQLTISALGGFAGPVTFGCGDFAGVCSFSPATANVAGTSATTVTLTVTATAAPTTAEISPISSGTILACGVPLFALFGIASVGRRRAQFAIIAIVLCGISCLGCGGGGGGGGGQQPASGSLPAGTYPFYVTATSGQNELAINAVLTVQ
jgi:Bacterial Ig-like domain (group 3)/FG-GAP-like repeat